MSEEEIDRVLVVSNVEDEKIDAELLYELFIQSGPIEKIVMPGKNTKGPPNVLVLFKHMESVPYAIGLFAGVTLYDQLVELAPREGSLHEQKMKEAEQAMNRRRSYDEWNRSAGPSPGFNSTPQWGNRQDRNNRMGGPYHPSDTPNRVPFPHKRSHSNQRHDQQYYPETYRTPSAPEPRQLNYYESNHRGGPWENQMDPRGYYEDSRYSGHDDRGSGYSNHNQGQWDYNQGHNQGYGRNQGWSDDRGRSHDRRNDRQQGRPDYNRSYSQNGYRNDSRRY